MTVNLGMSGKATLGSDYTLSEIGHTVIPANSSSATVVLHSIADHVAETKPETAIMTINLGAGYKVLKSKKATVSIINGP